MKPTAALVLGVPLMIGLGLGGYLLVTGGDTTGQEPAEKPEPAQEVAQVLTGVRLEGVDKDGANWVITAERAESDSAGEIGGLTGVGLTFTGRNGVVTAKAAHAERRKGETFYRFSGGVTLARGDWTASAESLTYDPAKAFVSGEEGVKVESGAVSLTGKIFETDLNETWARTRGGSSATIKGAQK